MDQVVRSPALDLDRFSLRKFVDEMRENLMTLATAILDTAKEP